MGDVKFWDSLTQPQAVLVAAAVGALGAVLGAFLANLIGQVYSARAGSRRQWDDTRHKTYAKVSESFYLLWDSFDSRGRPIAGNDALDTGLLAAHSAAALIARKQETWSALEQLLAAAQRLWADPAADWPATDKACHRAHNAFQQAARAELGIPTLDPPPYVAPVSDAQP